MNKTNYMFGRAYFEFIWTYAIGACVFLLKMLQSSFWYLYKGFQGYELISRQLEIIKETVYKRCINLSVCPLQSHWNSSSILLWKQILFMSSLTLAFIW